MTLSKLIVETVREAVKDLEPEKRNRFLWRIEEFFGEMGNWAHDLRRLVSDMRRDK